MEIFCQPAHRPVEAVLRICNSCRFTVAVSAERKCSRQGHRHQDHQAQKADLPPELPFQRIKIQHRHSPRIGSRDLSPERNRRSVFPCGSGYVVGLCRSRFFSAAAITIPPPPQVSAR